MDVSTLFGIWIAALLTLFIYSFLYKDNPFYKVAEYLFVGISAGYWLAYNYHNFMVPNLFVVLIGFDPLDFLRWYIFQPILQPLNITCTTARPVFGGAFAELALNARFTWDLLRVFAGLLGITMLFRFIPKLTWVSRYGIAYSVGLGAGLSFIVYMQANCIAQIQGTIIPPVVITGGAVDIGASIANTVLIVGVVTALIYFYFSKEHKGVLGGTARVGIWFLMVSFGAAFGFTVMARISLLIGRIEFLINDWIIGTLGFLGLA
ncbi:MAG: hypothetical protein JSW52_06570 [Candidatus Coatesbacteria bacterium]|nr:MAG: hypothetical protein JSW52_06570 [Candidatus Coatesbacteria bacterium]